MKVVPVVVGALGTIPKALGKHLDEIGKKVRIDLLQKDPNKDPRDNKELSAQMKM